MWYVVQVVGGREENVAHKIEKLVSDETFERCFVPKCKLRKRYSGEWKTRKEVLFPGYVFVDTKTPEAFRVELNNVPAMTKLLSGEGEAGERKFIPLTDEEKTLISSFMGDKEYVIKMSEGIIEGDEVRILDGALKGREMLVKKIDRHKRIAFIDLDILGRTKTVKVGLEIIKKS